VHATEKQLEEHGSKIDAELKSQIEAAIAEAKTAIESGDADAINAKSQALTDLAMKMGQAIYSQEQAAAAEAPADGADKPAADEEVVDAEFSEVDEDNKG
jgi:molecular chaperone DnaK